MKKLKKNIICYIGLGSNLDSPKLQLNHALQKLNEENNIVVNKISSFYKTKPVGYLEQPDFINAVAKITTNLSAISLMQILLKIEELQKRERDKDNRNMPRTLDLDLLFYGRKIIRSKIVEVPHPRIKQRAFVLVPLAEIAPRLVKNFLGNIEYITTFKLNSFKDEVLLET